MDIIETAQKLIPWATNLPLWPKIVVTVICVGLTALFLLLIWTPPASGNATTTDSTTVVSHWIALAKASKETKLVHESRPLPSDLAAARSGFETWWANTPLAQKRLIDASTIQQALSNVVGLYRLQEIQSDTKPTTFYWSDEAIRYFEQVSSRRELVEALLDKSAVYLELSQIEHTNSEAFYQIASSGDAVMARAAALADETQLPVAYRIWSRFYQNLARPRSGHLSDSWDNTYLSTAYERISKAAELAPDDPKTITQLARIAQRLAQNPPQDVDSAWIPKLRKIQGKLKAMVSAGSKNLRTPTERIPSLNILAVLTLDVIQREWLELEEDDRRKNADRLQRELAESALTSLREATTLLPQTEWKKEYDFDFHYDLSRIHCLRADILAFQSAQQSEAEFSEAISELKRAREGATTRQLDSAVKSLEDNSNFFVVSKARQARLLEILANRQ